MSEDNILVEELWRIFTFYSLHADPVNPDQIKIANFMRFVKDTQIVSKKLLSADIELDVTKVARQRRNGKSNINGHNVVYNTSFSLDFQDFLNSIDAIAPKVYSKDRPDIAVKRVLLENILFLASRRIPRELPIGVEMTAAMACITETFGKSLHNIFHYYYIEAIKRRHVAAAAAAAATSSSKLNSSYDDGSSSTKIGAGGKKTESEIITYKEYSSFCQEFGLRSTSLLTAIQVGEVFFDVVPLDYKSRVMCGMNFQAFCLSIMHMALIAYRDTDATITPKNKVMGLLLFMWKKINNHDKVIEIANGRQTMALSHAGSLNICGAGLFSDTLLNIWVKDSFSDYVIGHKAAITDGAQVLQNIVANNPKLKMGSSSSSSSSSSTGATADSTLNDGSNVDDAVDSDKPNDSSSSRKSKGVHLSSANIKELFTSNPELAEYVFMEINKMQLGM